MVTTFKDKRTKLFGFTIWSGLMIVYTSDPIYESALAAADAGEQYIN